jgi:hypothetical protein
LGGLFAFYEDGTPVPGWPAAGVVGFVTAAIEDLDRDGVVELVAADQGHVYVWSPTGNLKPGWPFLFPSPFDRPNKGAAVGDVDGDGLGDVAFGLFSIPALYVLQADGTSLPGFPLSFPYGLGEGLSMADVEDDGVEEIWIQELSGVRILDGNGEPLPGWPVSAIRGNAPPAIGDLDGDGHLEMVWGTTGGDANVYVFRDDGSLMPGWPIVVPTFTFNSQVALGDIDGDGGPDVVLGGFTASLSATGRIYAWHFDGTPVAGFPFVVPEGKSILGSSVTITDLDQDGDVDLLVGTVTGIGGTADGRVFAFDLPAAYNPTTMEWPTLGHDNRHTSRYEPPPRLAAHAGFDQDVECTSPDGAVVTLDGSHSADKDSTPGTNDDLVAFDWYENFGGPSEQFLGTGETIPATLSLGSHEITLRVTDQTGNQDTDAVRIAVVDTTAPELAVAPLLLWPPNHRLVSVAGEATDLCGPFSVELESAASSEPDDAPGGGDGATLGDIAIGAGGSLELRAERDGRGDGRVYTVAFQATDASGNSTTQTFEVVVPHDLGGSTEPLVLEASQEQAGTVLAWEEIPGAWSYDVVRGDLANLRELTGSYRLGSLTCIASGATETSTAGLEDPQLPPLGQGFFYLAGYDDGRHSGYGTEGAAKDRFVPPGQEGCR